MSAYYKPHHRPPILGDVTENVSDGVHTLSVYTETGWNVIHTCESIKVDMPTCKAEGKTALDLMKADYKKQMDGNR